MKSEHTPSMTAQQRHFATGGSPFRMYKDMVVGRDRSWGALFAFEAITSAGALPGLVGLGLRSVLYPLMLGASNGKPAIGRGTIIRQPSRIRLGRRVLVDDYVSLDVRGENASIDIGDHVSIGRFSTVAAKGGRVILHHGVNVGSYCRLATQSYLEVGESTLIAAYTYIGPGNHQLGDEQVPLIEREMEMGGGVVIGKHVWIGAHVTILDGVRIGDGAIIGAHSLVRENVPPRTVVAGTPARIIRELD